MGGEEGEFDKGERPPVPDVPGAIPFESDPVDDPLTPGAGGVGGDDLQPTAYVVSESTMLTNSSPAEPHVATDGTNVLLTWNWHAAASTDGGRTFQGMDPETFISTEGFCCDQLAHHIPSRAMWVWVMQTSSGAPPGPNHIRVAVTRGAQPFASPVQYTYWEWAPQVGGVLHSDAWFDRPKIGNTNEHLFLAVNAYLWVRDDDRPGGGFNSALGSLVIRMPLDELAAGGRVNGRCFGSGAQIVPVTQATNAMYLADHRDTSSLWLWRWPDAWESPDWRVVEDRDGGRLVKYANRGYSCRRSGVSSTDWCAGKSDERIQTGWISGGRIGFAWNAAQEGTAETPFPYVYSVFIDEATLTAVDHWSLKIRGGALQYPAFAPNPRGDLGGVVMYGGGEGPQAGAQPPDDRRGYPWCVAVIRDAVTGEWATWALREHQSTVDPRPDTREDPPLPRIGDYLGVWPSTSDQTWAASCMTYEERGTRVHFFRFGRPEDVPGN